MNTPIITHMNTNQTFTLHSKRVNQPAIVSIINETALAREVTKHINRWVNELPGCPFEKITLKFDLNEFGGPLTLVNLNTDNENESEIFVSLISLYTLSYDFNNGLRGAVSKMMNESLDRVILANPDQIILNYPQLHEYVANAFDRL